METRFGADFSRIQVHADRRARRTFPIPECPRLRLWSTHIYFNEGEYRPETQEGKRVLAHELTHVIQQGGGQTRLPVREHVTQSPGGKVSAQIQGSANSVKR